VGLLLAGGYDGSWGIESVPKEGDELEAARRSLELVRRLVGEYGQQPSKEAA
jgi:hypothetical protein